ncbi:outer membrane receptor protein involved in Fe transport [Altererythrobacter atlanticus]|uniref:Vitamin B12 transporter BtuB n=1 Tax=Croceibacterium atlanticum TaxID=1267766 RepID=A0A0F7KPM1_9SPHN|nr:TonB-dependent receptor [Croceibacterium atlanticum]AKH41524.1 Vitamin B12 transporter BtuB precursor [Croceibacterium atlanticum]MBB5732986.1 outer membrane receptor protein involved in Fe transport [Croceibacterium atlanticum]
MRSLQNSGLYRALLLAGCASTVTIAAPAMAQEEGAGQSNTIIVTGSRIQRADFENNSPTVTVDESLLQQSSTAALETNLNKLPQFTPAQTPQAGADIQPTATNTPGAATVSLRGIGANRNLVLLDGRRGTPGNASGVIDITTIPSAAIERVEIISGGASSTYGADAVAGVTNFILKKNFQGLELDGQVGITQEGDGFEYQLSGIMGTDFDDGRGNVSLAMSMNTREANLRADRKWYKDLYADTSTTGGAQFFINNPGILLDGTNGNYASGLETLFPDGNFSPNVQGTTVYLDGNGNPFVNGSFFDAAGIYGAPFTRYVNFFGYSEDVDGFNTKVTDAGTLSQASTGLQLVLPLTRYNFLARGNYEVNDWIGVFGQAMFSHVSTQTRNEPGPITGGWGVNIDPTQLSQDQLPASLWDLLDSRDNPDAPFGITTLMPDPRETFTDVLTYNIVAGLEGNIPGSDFTWDISVNHGVSQTHAKQTGIYSLERLRAVLTAPNFGQGFSATGNEAFGGFGASSATCTSGLNFFVRPEGGYSEDCLEAIRADLKNRTYTRQTIVEANLQGGLLDLPAGQVRGAIGASYRELDFEFTNDTLTTQGRSFMDQALGIYPSGNSEGFFDVKEAYGELLIPVLSDIPAIQMFQLELGGRVSDYSTTGTSYTYKILGDWEVTDWLRFRGGYNRAERAPNLAELYLARQQTFGVNTAGDLCSRANPLPYSANPANANGDAVYATCLAMMPNQQASEAYYNGGPGVTDNSTFGFAWPSAIGNPDLTPEKADTWTAGMVLNSPFNSPLLSRLRLSVDYYNIGVKDAIGQQTVAIVQRSCYDPALNPLVATDPAAAAQTAACQALTRNAVTGGLDNVNLTYVNNGRFRVQGIDAQLDWAGDVGPGTLGVNVQFTYLLSFKASELPTDPMVEYAGTQGPTSSGLNGGNYDYRVFTNVNYSIDGFMLGLQWQHLPSIEDATEASFPTTTLGAPSYNIFHLNGSYALTEDVNLRFGVDNLFNKAPPMTGVNPANTNPLATGNLPGGNLGTGFYDDNGRRFYLGANVKF